MNMYSDENSTGEGLTVRFWGVRGSIPTPGANFLEFGGNTACVEIRLGDRLFIIDAGSGLTGLGRALKAKTPQQVDILLSHLHHDHVSGLPFFGPALSSACTIRTFCGNLGGESAKGALDTLFSPPFFPVSLDALPATFEHVGFKAGDMLPCGGDTRIATTPLLHPGGATGYRFDHGGRRVCYLSDLEHTEAGPASHLVRFCKGADLVIYDCMYTSSEYVGCKGWGHSTWPAGLALCKAAAVKSLAAFHHHPLHGDAELEAIEADMAGSTPFAFMAREGQTFTYEPRHVMADAGVF